MKLKNLLFSIVVIMMVFTAGPALADEHGERLQAQKIALEKTAVSLTDCARSVESDSGGRVIRIEVEPYSLTQGPMCYEMLTVKGRTVMLYFVDVSTGRIIKKKNPLWGYMAFSAVNKASALEHVKVSMIQAVPIAEKEAGGKTTLVRVHRDSGIAFYQITMIVDDSLKRVLVDSYNGKVTEVPKDHEGHFED